MSKKVSFSPKTIITDDQTGIKAEILGKKDSKTNDYPVLIWDKHHIPTLSRLPSIDENPKKQDEYAKKMKSALKDSWNSKKIVKVKTPKVKTPVNHFLPSKRSPSKTTTKEYTLKSGRKVRVTTVKRKTNQRGGKQSRRKRTRKRRRRTKKKKNKRRRRKKTRRRK